MTVMRLPRFEAPMMVPVVVDECPNLRSRVVNEELTKPKFKIYGI
jgi:hypothetical protein